MADPLQLLVGAVADAVAARLSQAPRPDDPTWGKVSQDTLPPWIHPKAYVEACRADNAEAERDDLAATLETRTAEHALAMARVRELEYVLRAACDFFGAAWGSDACLRCGATRGHEAHGPRSPR